LREIGEWSAGVSSALLRSFWANDEAVFPSSFSPPSLPNQSVSVRCLRSLCSRGTNCGDLRLLSYPLRSPYLGIPSPFPLPPSRGRRKAPFFSRMTELRARVSLFLSGQTTLIPFLPSSPPLFFSSWSHHLTRLLVVVKKKICTPLLGHGTHPPPLLPPSPPQALKRLFESLPQRKRRVVTQ